MKNISLLAYLVAYRETHGDRNTTQGDEGYCQRTKVIIRRRLITRGYIIQYSITLKKSVTRTKSHLKPL